MERESRGSKTGGIPSPESLLNWGLSIITIATVSVLLTRVYEIYSHALSISSSGGRIGFTKGGPLWLRQVTHDGFKIPFGHISSVELKDGEIPSSVLDAIMKCDGIDCLRFINSDITDKDLARLSRKTRLMVFQLKGTQVSDHGLAHLRNLPNLKVLNLDDVPINGQGISHLNSLQNLTSLYLRGDTITDSTLARLNVGVNSLDLRGAQISDDGLMQLQQSHLRTLCLAETAVSDRGLKHLQKFKDLDFLNLEGTCVTTEGMDWLRAQLPNCYVLKRDENRAGTVKT